MKIIYKQPCGHTLFDDYDIENCYLKKLDNNDIKNGTKKEHHHTGFEIHIVNCGCQIYEIKDKLYKIEEGNFLIIPPTTKHKFVDSEEIVEKISVTFNLNNEGLSSFDNCIVSKTPEEILYSIKKIMAEYKNPRLFSDKIIENRVFEIVALLLRSYGICEKANRSAKEDEDLRLSMAKKYIRDNIQYNLTVSDVARYCYLSTKQLTRLFESYDNITPAKYIRNKKIEMIENLMSTDLTIEEISRKLQFSNQYNFHLFFKKYIGITPGEYKKMHKK